jgi:hypothetical protein
MDRLLKNTKILNFMEIRQLGAELSHADGQTDREDAAKETVYSAVRTVYLNSRFDCKGII